MKITTTIEKPSFYERFPALRVTTTRVCRMDGCENPGEYVGGYYVDGTRRIRQWECLDHWSGNPQLALPTPHWVTAAWNAEEQYYEDMRKRYSQNVDPERGQSVKTLAPSGHGEPLPFDRVKSWRWGV